MSLAMPSPHARERLRPRMTAAAAPGIQVDVASLFP
jgi:hypothetical protein